MEYIEFYIKDHTNPFVLTVECNANAYTEYGFFNPTSEMKIYMYCGIPDIEGNYSTGSTDASSIIPGLKNWTLTNIYDVVNGVTFFHNYSEIMGSRVVPYGSDAVDEEGNKVMEGILKMPLLQ